MTNRKIGPPRPEFIAKLVANATECELTQRELEATRATEKRMRGGSVFIVASDAYRA